MMVSMYDIQPFKSFIDLVYNSATNITLLFDKTGLRINLLNNSHVCFYTAEFSKDFFDSYEVGDEVVELVFDIKDLFLILKSSNKDDMLTLESEENTCIFSFESDTRRVFEVGLIDGSYENPAPPHIDFDVDFKMDWTDLKQCCDDLHDVVGTDRFVMVLNSDGAFVKSPEDAMKRYENRLSFVTYNPVGTTVNVDYLKVLDRLSKLGDLMLHMGNNIPLGWSVESLDVKYSGLIAPIIEDTV